MTTPSAPDPDRDPRQQPPPPPPIPVLPLGYSPPQPRRGSTLLFLGRMAIGFVVFALLTAGWFWLAARWRIGGRIVWGVWQTVTACLLGAGLYLRLRHDRPGYGCGVLLAIGTAGVLLVVGVSILIAGLCFRQ